MTHESFGFWRARLWPLHRYELKKILPLLLMKFCISLVYAILTCMKDTLIVTAKGSGAEVIPVLKGWVVLPVAIVATIVYAKLSNIFKRSTLFYITLFGFLLVFLLYGFLLYPNQEFLSPTQSANFLLHRFGESFSHWISVYRYWIQSIFFVTAELWATLTIFLLFWGCANQVTNVGEAKRTYTIFIAAGDLATFIAGPLILFYTKKYAHLDFLFTMQHMIMYVSGLTIATMGLHYYLDRVIKTDPRFQLPKKLKAESGKTKLSVVASIKHIFSSKYLLSLTCMVVAYGLCINLVEVNWKAHLKILYPSASDYQAFISMTTMIIGIVAFVTVLLVGGGMLRYLGWHFSAQASPIIIGFTGLVFLLLVLASKYMNPIFGGLGAKTLTFIVFFGAFQNISSKVAKYSFFDPTKEIAFIPLDHESKTKGKAAIDVIGSRFGKSGSAWIQVGLIDLIGTGSVISITPIVAPIVFIAIIAWMYSVRYVNKEFKQKEIDISSSS